MFTRLRSMAASAVLSCFFVIGALADTISTTLNYESTPNKLQGASVTYVDHPSPECSNYDYAYIGWQADQWDGYNDGYMQLCVEYQVYQGKAGVQGYMTNPAANKYSVGSSMSYSSAYAGVPYSISSPATGSWLAEGEHYAGYTSEYCPLQYNIYPFFNPWAPTVLTEFCYGGPPGYGFYIGPSSDGANAP